MLTEAPIYVNWNYTYACNFNCSHCYSRASEYPAELSPSQYAELTQQIAELGVFKVGLGGGEPIIRRDCLTTLSALAAANVHTNITTNGWLITERRAKQLADVNLSTMYLSIDGSNRAMHDEFRRKAGSFDKALTALETAVATGITTTLSTVLTRLNYSQIPDLVRIASDLGASGVEFKRFRPAGNGLERAKEYSTSGSPEKFIKSAVAEAKHDYPDLKIDLVYGAEPAGDTDSGCPCGSKSIVLRPNGDVSICAYSECVVGNVLTDGLGDIWTKSPELARIRQAGSCLGIERNPNPSNPSLTTSDSVAPGERLLHK